MCVVRKIRSGSENADDPEEQESKGEPNQDADQNSDFGLPPHLVLVRREPRDVPFKSRALRWRVAFLRAKAERRRLRDQPRAKGSALERLDAGQQTGAAPPAPAASRAAAPVRGRLDASRRRDLPRCLRCHARCRRRARGERELAADRAGVNGVIFGATALATATALPEINSGIAAVRLGDNALALGDIFCGNAV